MQSRTAQPGCSAQEYEYLLRKIHRLESENLALVDHIHHLEDKTAAYLAEIRTLDAEAREKRHVVNIGLQVRMRFLEKHRQRMGLPLDARGQARIRNGDRAVHRGRALVDSWVCAGRSMEDEEVYEDLYGVAPQTMLAKWVNIPDLVAAAGWRASLKAENKLFNKFEEAFQKLLALEAKYRDAKQLERVFDMNPAFMRHVNALGDMYAEVEAAGMITGSRRARKAVTFDRTYV